MRNTLRAYIVGFLVLIMVINPAWACHHCGGGWGGGYQYYGPVYYGGCGGCGGCGTVVVVDDCCGSTPCCGSTEGATTSSVPAAHEPAPSAPAEQWEPAQPAPAPVRPAAPVEQPAKVERPIDNTPAPSVPPQQPVEAAQPAMPPLPDQEANPPMPPADDLFSPPAEKPAAPAETPAASPAVPPQTPPAATDDLFGGSTTPAEQPAAPAEKPAEAPATPPQTPPAAPSATDDLFGGSTTPAEKAAEPAAPAETPAAPEAKPEEKPAETPGEEKKADDIFGAAPQILQEAGGLASNEMRLWTDNTGGFSCQGRLLRFVDGKVRLLKDNGRTTTVPLSRLSASDLAFVERQANAQRASGLQTAHAMSALPWMSN